MSQVVHLIGSPTQNETGVRKAANQRKATMEPNQHQTVDLLDSEDDRKPAAVDLPPPKRQRHNHPAEILDVAAQLGFKTNDRIEVQFTIYDDEADSDAADASDKPSKNDEASTSATSVSVKGATKVWWQATINGATGETHTINDDEKDETETANPALKSPEGKDVIVPIYALNYDPMESMGFPDNSVEEVAFISEHTLLNISSDEMMTFRRFGDPTPPSSPMEEDSTTASSEEPSKFLSKDETRTLIDTIMQKSFKNTGMDQKMKALPASQQMMIAERISHAKDVFFEKIVGEMERKKDGEKVLTGAMVKKCMAEMGEEMRY